MQVHKYKHKSRFKRRNVVQRKKNVLQDKKDTIKCKVCAAGTAQTAIREVMQNTTDEN